ncbi:MAG: tyrosine-type recombinase/integrase [Roseimicrobium sp.]
MASLRKFPDSKFWYACFTLPDGKRVQRSTKEAKRKNAQTKADTWETMSLERAKARQSHKVIAEIYRVAHKEELPDASIRGFAKAWLERRKGEISPASHTAYAAAVTLFLNWLGDKADRPLAELDTKHFVAFRDEQAKRVSANTVNKFIKQLRVVFEDARRDGYMSENPAKDCARLKAVTTDTRRPFTVDEIRSVLAVANDEWRSMILFGLYTGQRLADIGNMTWANVDLGAEEIRLRTAKTSRIMRIPICTPLMSLIEKLPAGDNPSAPLHPRTAALLDQKRGPMVSRQFGDLLASAGLVKKRDHNVSQGVGRASRRAGSELSFHSLRHTATSMMKNAGISPAVVQDIIGHDSVEMSTHYTHIESDAKRKALQSLPDLTPVSRS